MSIAVGYILTVLLGHLTSLLEYINVFLSWCQSMLIHDCMKSAQAKAWATWAAPTAMIGRNYIGILIKFEYFQP